MSGYRYGDKEPIEECGHCGGDAYAEFCDIGVGMQQISPYRCNACGAELCPLLADGSYAAGWVAGTNPSDEGEIVTGYYLNHVGYAFEMTFDQGHSEFNKNFGTNTSALLAQGWVRITNLEGYGIDLPPFMSAPTRRGLSKLLARIENETGWGRPYAMVRGAEIGAEMSWREVMTLVSTLPFIATKNERQLSPSSPEGPDEAMRGSTPYEPKPHI